MIATDMMLFLITVVEVAVALRPQESRQSVPEILDPVIGVDSIRAKGNILPQF